ncbi:translation initiation factor IF-2-like [Passer montanus]|uniref:translation initiation factor IF-2-like n=1 Tax=Passer montanus TaxID=9160 RepID=UPI001961CE5E|nr:translation initiation factor IF-2-like [Passer montanus]
MGERRAAAAAGETSLWLVTRGDSRRLLPCPLTRRQGHGGALSPPDRPPAATAPLRLGAEGRSESNRIEPSRAAPREPLPAPSRRLHHHHHRPFAFAFPAAAPGARPGGVPVPVRVWRPPYLRPPPLTGRGSRARRLRSAARPGRPRAGGAARPHSPPPAGRGLWPSLRISGPSGLRGAVAVWGPCATIPSVRADTGGHLRASAVPWRDRGIPGGLSGAGMWPGCHQPTGTGRRCVRDRAVARALPRPRCGTPGGLPAAWDSGPGQRRPPGKPELPVSRRYCRAALSQVAFSRRLLRYLSPLERISAFDTPCFGTSCMLNSHSLPKM